MFKGVQLNKRIEVGENKSREVDVDKRSVALERQKYGHILSSRQLQEVNVKIFSGKT